MSEASAQTHSTMEARRPAPPTALRIAVALILASVLGTLLEMILDYRSLIMPLKGPLSFYPYEGLGIAVAIALAVATLRRINWTRRMLVIACFLYALPCLAASFFAGYLLYVGPRSYLEALAPDAPMHLPSNTMSIVALTAAVNALITLSVIIAGILLVHRTCRTYTLTKSCRT